MKDVFLTNYTDISFLEKTKENLKKCKAFYFSVSFIKKAGLVLLENELEEALKCGKEGRIITSTYQNFTDIPSLKTFLTWAQKYPNFSCHLDLECFGENGFHTKGYMFDYDDSYEIVIGSSNITRWALLKNIEWNVSIFSKNKPDSYDKAMQDFNELWNKTLELNERLIDLYCFRLDYAIEKWDMDYINPTTSFKNPNQMQRKALKEIRRYRDMGVNKALIISATGSGKTYLAAFDARNFGARRLLYVVHRDVILKDAKDTFEKVFGAERTYGFYTGSDENIDSDFIFASTAMLSRHLENFAKNEFDYIVYDEVHHIVAESGKKIFEYFSPAFMLGLTATPERMDNKDVFDLFEQNIPFELRLRDAIINELVVPFHYYGIRSKLVNYNDKDRLLIAKEISKPENVEFISSQIEKYKPLIGKLKCIAFCTSIQHCKLMADKLTEIGYRAIALTGINDLGERIKAFKDLQDEDNPLEIICAVDILNEGVDIPKINMVLFLRPTESQTIFLQQLGRGLRKCEGKEYVTVLDFIGNNYDRSVQIALALGSLGKTTYIEKTFLKTLIKDNFKSIEIPGVIIDIDELSKEEIIHFIDETNFSTRSFLKKDYENFKKYLKIESYPSHMDYFNAEAAPDLIRFIKANIDNKKNRSYYMFLKKINELNIPFFSNEQIALLDAIEDFLPLVRVDEYVIINQLLKNGSFDFIEASHDYPSIKENTFNHALHILKKKKIVFNNNLQRSLINSELEDYLLDLLEYGITRYNLEFGEFTGYYALYHNYYSEQITQIICKDGIWQNGTYFNVLEKGDMFIFAGIKKGDIGKLNYKDKFLSSCIFQWESKNNTTKENNEGKKLINVKKVHLFIRKKEKEDGITLPYTYFGTGTLTNMRESYTIEKNKKYPTLLFDIKLDNEVPVDYHLDFEIEPIINNDNTNNQKQS